MESNIISGEEATAGMLKGIEVAYDLIRKTFGGFGSNVIIESPLNPKHFISNDAWTIVKDIKLTDPAEKRGLAFIQELCEKQDRLAGNSRKTAIILCYQLLKLGYESKINKLELKKELDKLIPIIENEIDKQTIQITVDNVEAVAITASENVVTGKLLQEIYQKIGKNGIIQPESSGTYETSYRFIDGVRFDMTGYLSPAFANDKGVAVYEKPLILITKKKIATEDDVNPILNEMLSMAERRPLIIFTNDMDSNVASLLVDLHKSGRLQLCIIKAPVLWQNYVFEDFARVVGATIIEDATGKNFKNLLLSDLGTCDKISVDQDETILNGTKDISAHIKSLQEKNDDDSKLRLSWLTNKTAILKLGASSESELSLKRLKTHDGIRSSQLALKFGIVKGGGLCLKEVADSLLDSPAECIMKEVLKTPYNINIENGVKEIPENIVDASAVIKSSVRHAISIASTILTASALVFIPEPTEIEIRLMELQNKQQPY